MDRAKETAMQSRRATIRGGVSTRWYDSGPGQSTVENDLCNILNHDKHFVARKALRLCTLRTSMSPQEAVGMGVIKSLLVG